MTTFKIIWDSSTLKRTEYKNGRYYKSSSFKNIDELKLNKSNFDTIQAKREARGANPIQSTLK